MTHWKRLWCWEGLGAGGEGDDRGWNGWMASLTRWTWVSVNSGSWWWTGRPGVLWFMGSQRVGHDWATELNWTELNISELGTMGCPTKGNRKGMYYRNIERKSLLSEKLRENNVLWNAKWSTENENWAKSTTNVRQQKPLVVWGRPGTAVMVAEARQARSEVENADV